MHPILLVILLSFVLASRASILSCVEFHASRWMKRTIFSNMDFLSRTPVCNCTASSVSYFYAKPVSPLLSSITKTNSSLNPHQLCCFFVENTITCCADVPKLYCELNWTQITPRFVCWNGWRVHHLLPTSLESIGNVLKSEHLQADLSDKRIIN